MAYSKKVANMPEPANCRSCGALITWVRTTTGALMPLDADPVAGGNIVIKDGIAHTLKGDLFEEMLDGLRYQSHFVSCPQHQKWRKKHGKS